MYDKLSKHNAVSNIEEIWITNTSGWALNLTEMKEAALYLKVKKFQILLNPASIQAIFNELFNNDAYKSKDIDARFIDLSNLDTLKEKKNTNPHVSPTINASVWKIKDWVIINPAGTSTCNLFWSNISSQLKSINFIILTNTSNLHLLPTLKLGWDT